MAEIAPGEYKSCGVLVLKEINGTTQFLLMKHANRYDLPKGHVEQGETEEETAFRELREETGFTSDDVELQPGFRYEDVYYPTYKRAGNKKVKKTLVIFLGRLRSSSSEVVLSEHKGCEWIDWNPPHSIQKNTIDGVLRAVDKHLHSSKSS
eukprot:TRINITY_DN6398_c0_g1_i1.p1 TRINITY_DN6398_c0_g1~~TRINITY_DN6398_c0_g1_i1.p1  ORF type:complete len:151 (-),score=31.22 TRINITY_DN6398_c0_g1_i1:188-640(-)